VTAMESLVRKPRLPRFAANAKPAILNPPSNLSSRRNMVTFGRYALCSLFLFSFDLKSVTIFNR